MNSAIRNVGQYGERPGGAPGSKGRNGERATRDGQDESGSGTMWNTVLGEGVGFRWWAGMDV